MSQYSNDRKPSRVEQNDDGSLDSVSLAARGESRYWYRLKTGCLSNIQPQFLRVVANLGNELKCTRVAVFQSDQVPVICFTQSETICLLR